nr:MAG TPA: hypothetical protein [Caudoviricetes sp.]
MRTRPVCWNWSLNIVNQPVLHQMPLLIWRRQRHEGGPA